MKFKLIKFESVKSTNDEAIKIIKKNKFNSCIITSKKQTKGRGTRGKKWISKKGNIFISLFFEVDLKKTKPEKFAILNPRIIKNILSKYSKYRITIKWPNDLLVKKRKLCGILQEVIEHNKNGLLVDFFDKDNLAKSVVSVLDNPENYIKLGKNARKTIVEKYDLLDVCLPKQIELVEELLNES